MLDIGLLRDQLRLSAIASAFDIAENAERKRSTQELTSLFYQIQAVVAPTHFVEVGAHEARFSCDMAALYPHSKVVAFEGSAINYAHFTSLIDYAARKVDYRHSLVSDIDGKTEMMLQTSWEGRPFPLIKGNDSMLRRNLSGMEYERHDVASTRLDTAFADVGTEGILFSLWIDVEGAAEQVFSGANTVLSNTSSIFIEVEEHQFWENQWLFDDVQAHLTKRGFFPLARDFEYPHQFNVIFIHQLVWRVAAIRAAYNSFLSRISHLQRHG
jgi:FkbM family methyltransferase